MIITSVHETIQIFFFNIYWLQVFWGEGGKCLRFPKAFQYYIWQRLYAAGMQ